MNTQQLRKPRFTSQQLVSIALAAAGIAVTLIGVVLLLAMAAREGLLTPPIRVAAGVTLALALGGTATWVRSRAGGRVGSIALLSTAAAAAFFDVVAVTRIYDWVPLGVGLALALCVGACAGALAIVWREKHLFHAIVLAVALLAPFLTGGINLTLIGFLVVLQITGIAPEVRQEWDATALVRSLPAITAAFLWAISRQHSSLATLLTCAGIAALGVAGAMVAARTRNETINASAALVLTWIPLWTASGWCDRPVRTAICGAMLAVAATLLYLLRNTNPLVRVALTVDACVSALMLALACAQGDWKALPFLAAAVALMGLHVRVANKMLGYAALVALPVGFLLQFATSPYLDLFYRSRAAHLPTSVPVAGALFLAFGVLGALAVRGKRLSTDYVQTILVVCGFSAVLGLAMVTVAATGGSSTAFFVGHLVITVLAVALAALVLTSGLQRPRHLGASMVWGLTLVGCALAKLFLFDLHYMGAMTKAFAFLGTGLVLLAAGTAYARTYAEVSARTKPRGTRVTA